MRRRRCKHCGFEMRSKVHQPFCNRKCEGDYRKAELKRIIAMQPGRKP